MFVDKSLNDKSLKPYASLQFKIINSCAEARPVSLSVERATTLVSSVENMPLPPKFNFAEENNIQRRAVTIFSALFMFNLSLEDKRSLNMLSPVRLGFCPF